MSKFLSVARAMLRESRRIGQNGASRYRANQREALSLAFNAMRQDVQSAPHGFPVGAERSAYRNGACVAFLRVVAA